MTYHFANSADRRTVPIIPIETDVFNAWRKKQDSAMRLWVKSTGFKAKPASMSLVGRHEGSLAKILLGLESPEALWS